MVTALLVPADLSREPEKIEIEGRDDIDRFIGARSEPLHYDVDAMIWQDDSGRKYNLSVNERANDWMRNYSDASDHLLVGREPHIRGDVVIVGKDDLGAFRDVPDRIEHRMFGREAQAQAAEALIRAKTAADEVGIEPEGYLERNSIVNAPGVFHGRDGHDGDVWVTGGNGVPVSAGLALANGQTIELDLASPNIKGGLVELERLYEACPELTELGEIDEDHVRLVQEELNERFMPHMVAERHDQGMSW
jgi:hypothetical protein